MELQQSAKSGLFVEVQLGRAQVGLIDGRRSSQFSPNAAATAGVRECGG